MSTKDVRLVKTRNLTHTTKFCHKKIIIFFLKKKKGKKK